MEETLVFCLPRTLIYFFGLMCINDDGVNSDGHQRDKREEPEDAANEHDVLEEANLGQRLLRTETEIKTVWLKKQTCVNACCRRKEIVLFR